MSEEDLVKLATDTDEEILADKLTEAAKFIYEIGIKHGDTPVTAEIIYHTYKHWKYYNNKQPKAYFFRDFSKYFERRRNKHGIFYLLDPKPFDLSDENYWIIRAEIRRERRRKKT